MVRALPIIVAPVHRIVCVTLLYVTMIFDHELVKVTLLSLYQLRLITHLSSVICRRGEMINESFRCLDQSLCAFTHPSHDSEHVPSLYAGGGRDKSLGGLFLVSNVRVSRLTITITLQCRHRESQQTGHLLTSRYQFNG